MSKSQDQHEIISVLKDLAIELGRIPTKVEVLNSKKISDYAIRTKFGTYAVLLQAADLKPDNIHNRELPRITNAVFEVNLENHLQNYKPANLALPYVLDPFPNAAIISDIHWPFVNQKVVDRFYEYVGDIKPTWVIINGDAWDMYAHTKFPRSHNQFKPRDEEEMSHKMNTEFWQKVGSLSPDSKCRQLFGNHDLRPMKRVLESYPEAEDWIKQRLNSMFTFQGVETIYDPREELFISNNIIVFHGYKAKLGDHRDYTLYSTCNGHSHAGGVVYRKIRGSVLFEANSGLAGDPEAKGLTYTAQKMTHWTPGFLGIDKLGPRFVAV